MRSFNSSSGSNASNHKIGFHKSEAFFFLVRLFAYWFVNYRQDNWIVFIGPELLLFDNKNKLFELYSEIIEPCDLREKL